MNGDIIFKLILLISVSFIGFILGYREGGKDKNKRVEK